MQHDFERVYMSEHKEKTRKLGLWWDLTTSTFSIFHLLDDCCCEDSHSCGELYRNAKIVKYNEVGLVLYREEAERLVKELEAKYGKNIPPSKRTIQMTFPIRPRWKILGRATKRTRETGD